MSKPTTLAIDTTRERLQLALLMADGRIAHDITDIAKGHAEIIMDRIDVLLAGHGLAYSNLDRIAVTTGPGSFTGLRIGLSVARGLGLALDVPVIGVPTLLAVSLSGAGAGQIILEAGRAQAYVQRFSGHGQPEGAPLLADLDEALAAASKARADDWRVDIAAMACFAADADPAVFPPDPVYIRPADAKPQTKGRVARQ